MSYAADFVRHTRADLDIEDVSLTAIETLERADAELARKDERIAELEDALATCADISSQPGVVRTARALLEKKP